jgi:hypothetical protein
MSSRYSKLIRVRTWLRAVRRILFGWSLSTIDRCTIQAELTESGV